MTIILTSIQAVGKLWRNTVVKSVIPLRGISVSANLFQSEFERLLSNESAAEQDDTNIRIAKTTGVPYINKDRSLKIPYETSIRYMKSEAYKITYGDKLVWQLYKRNFKGQFAPTKTRKTCIRGEEVSTGNPCPICRDEYLVLDYRNVDLLNQFISANNGEILSYQVTNICQHQYKNLLVEIKKARDYGTISYDPPHRTYTYSKWYKPQSSEK